MRLLLLALISLPFVAIAQKAELVLPKGHSKSIYALAFSSDGNLVLSGSYDQTAKLWHTATGRQLRTFSNHLRDVSGVAFTPDSKYGITAGGDKRLKLWNLATGEEIMNYGSTEELENLKIGKDSRELMGHNYGVNDVAMHPNGKTFYSCASDAIIQWDLESGKIVNQIYEGAYKIKISPNGQYLAFLKMGKLYIYNIQTRKLEREIGSHTDYVIFKGDDHKCEESCIGHAGGVKYFAFNTQNNQIVTAGGDRLVMLWDVATGKQLATYGEHSHPTYAGNTSVIKSCNDDCKAIKNNINGVGFAKDDNYLVAAGGKQVAIWDITSPESSQFYEIDVWVNQMDVHPNGKYIVAGSSQGISFFDLQNGKVLNSQPGYQEGQTEIALSPDGKTAITGRFYNKAQSWDIATGKLIHNFNSIFDDDFTDGNAGIHMIAFDQKGEKVLIGGNHLGLKLWDVHSGEMLMEFQNARFGNTAGDLSLDGTKAITANYKEILVWDTNKPNAIFTFEQHGKFDDFFKMKISSDGKRAYAAGQYRTIYVYDIENGVELKPFGKHKVHLDMGKKMKKSEWTPRVGRCVDGCYGHTGDIRTLDISKDNKRLLTGGEKEWILWDVATQNIILRTEIDEPRANFNSLYFMKGEERIIGSYFYETKGGWKNKLKIWDAETGLALREFQTDVSEFVLTQDEKYLITRTGRVDLEKGELLNQRLYFENPNDFMYITPDNYYFASKNAAKQLHFVKGLQPYSFDQFDLIYNRPDIVLKKMGMAPQNLIDSYKAAYTKRLEKMGFDAAKIVQFLRGDAINDLSAPEVYLDQEMDDFPKTKVRQYSFRYKAVDPRGKSIERLFVEVNGVPVLGAKGLELYHTSKDTLRGEFLGITLSEGLNKIEFSVMNGDGVYSLKKEFEITYEGSVSKPNLHVVAIGVSKYQDAEMNLDYAAKDAKDLSNLLASQRANYGQIFRYHFLNEQATKANILAVKEKLKRSHVDDKVVIFVAGHGLLDDKFDYYIATHDVDFANPAQKGLPYEALEGLLDGIPARKKLMLIDACHSGEVDKDEVEFVTSNNQQAGKVKYRGFKNKGVKSIGLKNSFELMQELFNDLRSGTGAMVISAASGVEFSYESPEWNNGVFTYAIMEGLKTNNADKDGNNEITVTELRDYAIERVIELTNGKQTPTSRRENLEFDFGLW